ncbi:MAG TPA: DUF4209 domain-containing protein [Deltaproteobacteria bacterium]|nr:DUF4209 domain-containing protein [Deltaproteobacteria bacterium]HQB38962.1 DUF4209 domain-containing protein [Deltaproteobacteria bacterium]
MSLRNIAITKSDFDEIKWCSVIDESEKKECHSYDSRFFAKAKEAAEIGNERAEEAWTLLGAICSFHMNAGNKDEPFGPMLVMQTGRSAIVADLSPEHLQALTEIFPDIQDPEIRARIGDVLWLTKRDFRAAVIAVEAYLESAIALEDPSEWTTGFERIERAFRLSATLGKKAVAYDKVVSHIESVLDKYNGNDPLFLSAKLMELLLEHRHGDPVKYSEICRKVAQQSETQGNYRRARDYWEIKSKWDALAKNQDEEKSAKINVAETFVKEAAQTDSALVTAKWLEQAIQVYRRIGGQKKRIDEIHAQLVEVQNRTPEEMQEFHHQQDASELIESSIAKVTGKSLHDGIFALCLLVSPPKVSRLKKQAVDSFKKYIFKSLFPGVIVNEKGKVIGRQPDINSNDPEEVERAKRAEMFSLAQFDHIIDTQGAIEPARRQLLQEHNVNLGDFLSLVKYSPFVPENREQIYARGLYEGMKGDFVVAVHLLIPQIENSIREILEHKGIAVSKLDDQGIQNGRDLNDILYEPALKEVLGEDIVFDLQGLLIERHGSNFRNRLAHGLVSDDGFYIVEVPYLWWLILRIVCLPVIAHLKEQQNKKVEEDNKKEDE